MFFRLPFDVILQISHQSGGITIYINGSQHTPIGFAAVRIASESNLKVSDMICKEGSQTLSSPLDVHNMVFRKSHKLRFTWRSFYRITNKIRDTVDEVI
jgi:hypothetical protein